MKFMTLFYCFIAIVIFSSCDRNNTLSSTSLGTIKGYVVDIENFVPIENVHIYTKPPSSSVFTYTNGFFEIKNIIDGKHQIIARKQGYKTSIVNVNVVPNKTVEANIILRKLNPGEEDDYVENNDSF